MSESVPFPQKSHKCHVYNTPLWLCPFAKSATSQLVPLKILVYIHFLYMLKCSLYAGTLSLSLSLLLESYHFFFCFLLKEKASHKPDDWLLLVGESADMLWIWGGSNCLDDSHNVKGILWPQFTGTMTILGDWGTRTWRGTVRSDGLLNEINKHKSFTA